MFVFKLGAYFYTHSAAMLSEAIHSLADLLNQVSRRSERSCDIHMMLM